MSAANLKRKLAREREKWLDLLSSANASIALCEKFINHIEEEPTDPGTEEWLKHVEGCDGLAKSLSRVLRGYVAALSAYERAYLERWDHNA